MEITSLTRYKGTTYEMELDGERKLYLHIDIITDFGLAKGMELERQELRKIIYASNFRRAYEYALYRLDYRDYSAEEIFQKLVQTYKNEKLCLDVIRKLAAAGIINDRRYAEKLGRRYVEGKKYGYRRAKREMRQKGLAEDLTEDILRQYSGLFEENLAELLNAKYSRFLTDSSDRKSVEKAKNALVRFGYGYDEINKAVKEYFERGSTDYAY